MRTTVDIDPVVLSAARAKAAADRTSVGKALSELALAGLRSPHPATRTATGFPVMAGVPGHIVTDELVAEDRDDDPGSGDVR